MQYVHKYVSTEQYIDSAWLSKSVVSKCYVIEMTPSQVKGNRCCRQIASNLGTMTAVTSIFFPVGDCISDVVKDCSRGLCANPPIPETLADTCLTQGESVGQSFRNE